MKASNRDSESDSRDRAPAEKLFAEFLRRRQAGEEIDLAGFCREHPQLADGIRWCHSIHFGAPLEPVAMLVSLADEATRHEVFPGVTEIGAASDAEITIDRPEISFRHARIEVPLAGASGQMTLTDCESMNGTFVNDRRVDTCRVRHGDRVRFARSEFELWILPGGKSRQTVEVAF